MKDHGIDMQIICTIPVMFSYWAKPADGLRISQFLNDHIAQLFTQYPQHFIGLATVPMQNTELAVRELERCKQLGFKGVQIGSNVNQLNLNAPEFQNFFAACEALNLSVLIHPWEMMGQEHMEQYWLPWLVGMPAEITRALCSFIFGGLFDRYPKLRVCFAHGGGNFIGTLGRLEHGWSCRPDLVAIDNPNPPSSYLGRFWVDSHVCDSEQLTLLVKKLGADKVIQGSDYPFPLGESSPGHLVRNSGLNESVQNSIFNSAPKAWLGI
jgi:aminocarboxymuconate-semialdehyde decarboxylase